MTEDPANQKLLQSLSQAQFSNHNYAQSVETYFKQLEIHEKDGTLDAQAEYFFQIGNSLDYLGNPNESINAFKDC